MRYLSIILSLLLSVCLLLSGCQTKTASGTTQSSESSLGKSTQDTALTPDLPEEIPPEELISTRQPINKELSGYQIKELHLSVLTEEDGTLAQLTFHGPGGGLSDTAFGRVIYYTPEELVALSLYSDDFETAHELYDVLYFSEDWSVQEYDAAAYTGEGAVLGEPTLFSEDELLDLAKEFYDIIQKEMAGHER